MTKKYDLEYVKKCVKCLELRLETDKFWMRGTIDG
jgi:hypothetical protein